MFVLKHVWDRWEPPFGMDPKYWIKLTLIESAIVIAIYGLESLIS